MSMLLFYVGENRYVIEYHYITSVIPKVHLKKMPYMPPDFSGLLNFGGEFIPIVDFCKLIEQREAAPFLHSRIILVKNMLSNGVIQKVGLLGEKVGEIIDIKLEQFKENNVYGPHFPYLDHVYIDAQGGIQYINVEKFFHFLTSQLSVQGKNTYGF